MPAFFPSLFFSWVAAQCCILVVVSGFWHALPRSQRQQHFHLVASPPRSHHEYRLHANKPDSDDVIELDGGKKLDLRKSSEISARSTEEAMKILREELGIAVSADDLDMNEDDSDDTVGAVVDNGGEEDSESDDDSEVNDPDPNTDDSLAELPRLHADLSSMVRWIERFGGLVDASVHEKRDGWTLHANRKLLAGTTVLSIPKSLCMFSDPELMQENPLLENAQVLINSLDKRHWRARLAIALLSERVRPNSFYRAFLRNLPFEFWGMPVFYSTSEFGLLQDVNLMQKTRDRCRFLSEFADSVLLPLQRTARDPFSGNSADVNAFGWGFASASSRALRNPAVVGPSGGAVMVPGIDIASHSDTPNCVVVDEGDSFVLKTIADVSLNSELTISYGSLSNDELFSDYGFTTDNNAHDSLSLSIDPALINSAREVMGQSKAEAEGTSTASPSEIPINSPSAAIQRLFGSFQDYNASSTAAASAHASKVGMSDKYNEQLLYTWQINWLRALRLVGPNADYSVMVGVKPERIDGRLWAYLRVLYARTEEALSVHGYDPFLLQTQGSMLSPREEAEVVKTLVGLLAVVIRSYGTDHERDLLMLRSEAVVGSSSGGQAGYGAPVIVGEGYGGMFAGSSFESGMEKGFGFGTGIGFGGLSLDGSQSALSAQPDDIITETHRILRNTFRVPHPPVVSPTVRRLQQSLAASGGGASSSSLEGSASRGSGETEYGSVEDMVRLSSSAAVLRPPTAREQASVGRGGGSAGSTRNGLGDKRAQDEEEAEEERLRAAASGLGGRKLEADAARVSQQLSREGGDLDGLGLGLPFNVREALRYRIRRKRALSGLMLDLGDLHKRLQSLDPSIEDLLPPNPEDRNERRAKIRELMDEVRSSGKDDVLVTSTKISEKFSSGGLAL